MKSEKIKVKKKNLKFIILLGIAAIFFIVIQTQQKSQKITYQTPSPSPSPLILTADERFILNPPSAEASKSALAKHAKMVATLAKPADTLEVTACRPNPLVLNVKLGSQIKIQNNDETEHKIIVDGSHYYKIPPKSSQIIKVEFKYGTGDYGYVCEGVGIVGFMHVES